MPGTDHNERKQAKALKPSMIGRSYENTANGRSVGSFAKQMLLDR